MRLARRLALLVLILTLLVPMPAFAQDPGIYVVQPGDTLTGIARQQNTTVAALIAANALTDPNTLYVGQQLRLPGASAPAPQAHSAPATSSSGYHIVQRGETLGLIARRYGVTVQTLVAANALADPSRIYPGQQLVIPGVAGSVAETPVVNSTPTGPAPVRIVAPSIGLDSQVIPTGWRTFWVNGQQQSEWVVVDYAAGWHKTSAPVGQPGNTVISGHHNIKGEVFRWLVNLKPGDPITLYAADGTSMTYTVAESHILPDRDQPLEVRQRNAQWIAPTNDTRLTLVTCWPYTTNTHRLIVVAFPAAAAG